MNLLTRIAALESRRPAAEPLRIVRLIIGMDREPVGAVARPGHHMIERRPGESVEALHAGAESSR